MLIYNATRNQDQEETILISKMEDYIILDSMQTCHIFQGRGAENEWAEDPLINLWSEKNNVMYGCVLFPLPDNFAITYLWS